MCLINNFALNIVDKLCWSLRNRSNLDLSFDKSSMDGGLGNLMLFIFVWQIILQPLHVAHLSQQEKWWDFYSLIEKNQKYQAWQEYMTFPKLLTPSIVPFCYVWGDLLSTIVLWEFIICKLFSENQNMELDGYKR